MADKKMELKIDNKEQMSAGAMVALIDTMMESGVSRLKIKESDKLNEGDILKEYHHGRCDIGSPWAKGQAFDVIE